jgi:hypothetical protein
MILINDEIEIENESKSMKVFLPSENRKIEQKVSVEEKQQFFHKHSAAFSCVL